MPTILLAGVAILAGICISAQYVLNASLSKAIGSAWWAGFVSFLLGTLFMLVAALVTRQGFPSGDAVHRAPMLSWVGGFLGGFYIAVSSLLVPRLGVALVRSLFVVGQMLGSLAFDQFGILGVPQHPVSLTRILGAGALIAGVLLIKAG